LFYHVFGRFSVRGVQKHENKSGTKSDQPPRNQPTTSGSAILFCEGRLYIQVEKFVQNN
jgi:hypothetical protein